MVESTVAVQSEVSLIKGRHVDNRYDKRFLASNDKG